MDLITAGLPLVGSIQLLVNMAMYENTDALGNTRVLSYSIMAVYGHLVRQIRHSQCLDAVSFQIA